MPNATVRADARALSEATPHPAEDIRSLAAQFEAAWAAERVFFHGGGTDEESNPAIARVDEVAQKIVAIPTTDIEMMRLKARVYLWSEAGTSKPSLPITRATARPRRCLFPCSAILVPTVRPTPISSP
jgi:hypothetical protein